MPVPIHLFVRKLYFVKVDIVQAFDTINQKKLCDVIEKYIEKSDYFVRRFTYFYSREAKARQYSKKYAESGG